MKSKVIFYKAKRKEKTNLAENAQDSNNNARVILSIPDNKNFSYGSCMKFCYGDCPKDSSTSTSNGGASGCGDVNLSEEHKHEHYQNIKGCDDCKYFENGPDVENAKVNKVASCATSNDCKDAKNTLLKTSFSLIFSMIGMISNLVILAIVHERVPRDIKRPLPDLSFSIFPKYDGCLYIAEYIIIVTILLVLFLFFIHRQRLIILRRVCLIMGVIYIFRGICMISTVFPLANQNYYCVPQIYNSTTNHPLPFGQYVAIIASRVGSMLLGFGLSINGRHNYCGDYLFSGHTVTLVLGYLTLREYLMPLRCRTIAWKLFHLALFTSTSGGIICIIIARGHYLIDILLAYYLTTRVFWIYHTMVYNHFLLFATQTNYLSRVWWFKFLLLLEDAHKCKRTPCDSQICQICHCDSPIPIVSRSFECPLPWARFFRRRMLLRYQQRLLPTQAA